MTTATATLTETVQYKTDSANILKTGTVYQIVVPRKRLRNARWLGADGQPVQRLGLGEQVRLVADAQGLKSGTPVSFKVLCPARGSADDPMLELEGVVKDGRAEAVWTNDGEDSSVPLHEYAFLCTARNKSTRSTALLFTDSIELELEEGGKPCAGVGYVLTLGDGSERKGTLDAAGKAAIEDLPAGNCKVRFEHDGDVELAS